MELRQGRTRKKVNEIDKRETERNKTGRKREPKNINRTRQEPQRTTHCQGRRDPLHPPPPKKRKKLTETEDTNVNAAQPRTKGNEKRTHGEEMNCFW